MVIDCVMCVFSALLCVRVCVCAHMYIHIRDVAVTMGQALVDTKRLRIVSSLDNQFKDETNMFLEFGQAADMSAEQIESPTDLDAPKWFQRLPENGDSEAERSHSQNPDYEKLSVK